MRYIFHKPRATRSLPAPFLSTDAQLKTSGNQKKAAKVLFSIILLLSPSISLAMEEPKPDSNGYGLWGIGSSLLGYIGLGYVEGNDENSFNVLASEGDSIGLERFVSGILGACDAELMKEGDSLRAEIKEEIDHWQNRLQVALYRINEVEEFKILCQKSRSYLGGLGKDPLAKNNEAISMISEMEGIIVNARRWIYQFKGEGSAPYRLAAKVLRCAQRSVKEESLVKSAPNYSYTPDFSVFVAKSPECVQVSNVFKEFKRLQLVAFVHEEDVLDSLRAASSNVLPYPTSESIPIQTNSANSTIVSSPLTRLGRMRGGVSPQSSPPIMTVGQTQSPLASTTVTTRLGSQEASPQGDGAEVAGQ